MTWAIPEPDQRRHSPLFHRGCDRRTRIEKVHSVVDLVKRGMQMPKADQVSANLPERSRGSPRPLRLSQRP